MVPIRWSRHAGVLIALAALTGAGPASAQQLSGLAAVERADSLERLGDAAFGEGRPTDAATLYADAAELWEWGNKSALLQFSAAVAHAQAEDVDAGYASMEAAIEAGLTFVELTESYPGLEPLRDDPRWPNVVERVRDNQAEFRRRHGDPEKARLVTADLERFVRAYDRAIDSDPETRSAILRAEYLETGSPGLVDFYIRGKIDSVDQLAETTLKDYPRFFGAMRSMPKRVAAVEPRIREAFRNLAALYDDAFFPDVYFLVGHFKSGGTISGTGLLIGTETYGIADDVPLDEFPDGRPSITRPVDDLPHVVAHELIHFQQPLSGGGTLLRAVLVEGGADFVASLIVPDMPREKHYSWGEAHEREVWERFESQMHGSDTSDWIANNHEATEEWPAALGYFVGHQIAKAYYDVSRDKRQAIRDLLELKDPEAILRTSGYADRFREGVSLEAIEAANGLYDRGVEAYLDGRHTEAAGLFVRAVAEGHLDPVSANYNAACSLALAGHADEAFERLDDVVAGGWRNVAHLEADSDLASLRGDDRWTGITSRARENLAAYETRRGNPENARFITADIDRFWNAFDLARSSTDPETKVDVFRREYYERGTRGLLDFYQIKTGSVERLVETIQRYPRFYETLREGTQRVAELTPVMRRAFRALEELYPLAVFPDVYFVIGRLNSDGTVSDRGLLIGVEHHARTAATVLDELPEAYQGMDGPESIPHIVAHELIHFQQSSQDRTLLEMALKEGGADFLADLLVPGRTEPDFYAWGDAHEREVWERFRREMHGADASAWIGNFGRGTDEWAHALGYYIGHRIARAYYERAESKEQAVVDLLRLEDPERILEESGYAERFGG